MANFHFELTEDDAQQQVIFRPNVDKTDIVCWACNEPIVAHKYAMNVRSLLMAILTHVCR